MTKSIATICLLSALMVVCWFNWPAQHSYIPRHLWGVWKTDHARYTDRYLDISEAIFTIGQGGRQLEVFFIQKVEMVTVGARQQFTLHFTDAGKARGRLRTFSFFVEPTESGLRLRLKNRPSIVWHRNSPPRQAVPEDRP